MLPTRIDPNETHVFFANDSRGLHVGFFRMGEPGQAPLAQHWLRECQDERSLQAMLRWLCIRRDLWQEWGALAERVGQEEFATYLNTLMASEPVEVVESAFLRRDENPCVIAIGELVSGAKGQRQEVLYRHRFDTPEARDRFFDWFENGQNFEQMARLAKLAYNRGTAVLSEELDTLTTSGIDSDGRSALQN